MYNLIYDIKLNENGRPYIDLPEEYEHHPEDRFFAMEVSRYVLQQVQSRRSSEFDEETNNALDTTIKVLGQVSDEIAKILYGGMVTMGEMDLMMQKPYYFHVNNIDELKSIGDIIVFKDRIYKKQEGIKALVIEENEVYKYEDEIWKKIE